MVGVGRAHSLTGVLAQYGSFKKVPQEFVNKLGEKKALKLTEYVKELAKGDDDNLNKLIDLLEEAEEKIPDKELMTLINEINDFIVPNQQSEKSKSKLRLQKNFQDKVINSNTLDDLIDKLDDPKTASGDSLSAFIKDFQTERLETLAALNKDYIANELNKIKAEESTDQDKLKELIAVAGDVYKSDSDKAQMINDVLSGFKGLDYNVKAIIGGNVREVENHKYTHRGGAAGDDGEIATRVAKWVEVGDISDDPFSSSRRPNDVESGDFSYLSSWRNEVDNLDTRGNRSRERERRIERNRRCNWGYHQRNARHGGGHWGARTPHGDYAGGSTWRPTINSVMSSITDLLGGGLQQFLFGHALGRTVIDGFNGNLSSGIYGSPHGLHWETTTAYNTGGYDNDRHHQGGYPVAYGYGQNGSGGYPIEFNPTIEVSPIINNSSQSNPDVSTNTPVKTFVPNYFRPNIPGFNNTAQFPFTSMYS